MDVIWLRSAVLEVGVITHGARLVSVRTPDRDGRWDDVVLGLADLDAYRRDTAHLGACVGRYANRIAGARFTLDGVEHRLTPNEGANTLHGGPDAFGHAEWRTAGADGSAVTLEHTSPAGENGFPGTVDTAVTYAVDGATLRITHTARTDAPTVVNMTNHAYWNLAGGGSTADHQVQLAASRVLPVDDAAIPTGPPVPVADTPLDFRSPTPIGTRIRDGHPLLRAVRGYDHAYVLDETDGGADRSAAEGGDQEDGLHSAARVLDPRSGRTLTLRTDQPSVQFYTGNSLTGSLLLRTGHTARQGDAFCLEPQGYPDAPNHADYPSTVLRPGETYRSRIAVTFGTV